jgi:hypothetical protein
MPNHVTVPTEQPINAMPKTGFEFGFHLNFSMQTTHPGPQDGISNPYR